MIKNKCLSLDSISALDLHVNHSLYNNIFFKVLIYNEFEIRGI